MKSTKLTYRAQIDDLKSRIANHDIMDDVIREKLWDECNSFAEELQYNKKSMPFPFRNLPSIHDIYIKEIEEIQAEVFPFGTGIRGRN